MTISIDSMNQDLSGADAHAHGRQYSGLFRHACAAWFDLRHCSLNHFITLLISCALIIRRHKASSFIARAQDFQAYHKLSRISEVRGFALGGELRSGQVVGL